MRKHVLGVSDQVGHKPSSTTTEDYQRFEISGLRSRGIVLPTTLIRCAVTAHLMCAFVFAHAKSRFSRDAAHLTSA